MEQVVRRREKTRELQVQLERLTLGSRPLTTIALLTNGAVSVGFSEWQLSQMGVEIDQPECRGGLSV